MWQGLRLLVFMLSCCGCVALGLLFDRQDPPQTLLFTAAGRGDVREIDRLVARGGQIEQFDVGGETPLMLTAGAGHGDAVTVLLPRGAKINARSAVWGTALCPAASDGPA